MSTTTCTTPLGLDALAGWWLDELPAAEQERVEAHLFACAGCAARMQQLHSLAAGVRQLARRGAVNAVVAASFPAQLAAAGARVREYRVPAHGGVQCTVAPEDDAVCSRLEAPLDGVTRVDVEAVDAAGRTLDHLADVPFDPAAGMVVLSADAARLRALPATRLRYRLLAVEPSGKRLLGEYTFDHSPWPGP